LRWLVQGATGSTQERFAWADEGAIRLRLIKNKDSRYSQSKADALRTAQLKSADIHYLRR
jgi:hypothetical protein